MLGFHRREPKARDWCLNDTGPKGDATWIDGRSSPWP
jgi:hypothetical protein